MDLTYLLPVILIGGACGTWLIIRRAYVRGSQEAGRQSVFLTLGTAFFVLLTVAILTMQFRTDTYARPLLFFACVAIMSGIIAAEIPFSDRRMVPLVIGQILIVALATAWSITTMFPNVLGLDPWVHQWFVNKLIAAGHVPANWGYSDFPFFHLFMGETELLLDVNYVAAQYPLTLAILVVQVGVLYAISQRLFSNHHIALYSALATTFAAWVMVSGVAPTPSKLGFTFVIIALFFLLQNEWPQTTVMMFFFTFVLVWTHTLGAVSMLVILLTGLIVSRMKWSDRVSPGGFVDPVYVLFFGAIMALWWSTAEFPMAKLSELISAGFSNKVFTHPGSQVESVVPMMESIFNLVGTYLFYAVALIGTLFTMSRRGTIKAATFSAIGLVLFGIGFVALVGKLGLLQDRWWFYSQYLLAIPLGAALYLLLNISSKKRPSVGGHKALPVVLISLMVVSLSFLAVMNPISNDDNPMFSPNSSVRSSITVSELEGASFASSQTNATLYSDYDFGVSPSSNVFYNYYHVPGMRLESLDDSLVNNSWSADGTMKVVRTHIIDHPFHVSGWDYSLNYDLNKSLYASDLSKVYTNSGLSAYT